MIKTKFDPNDCRDCLWNHANYADDGFAKRGHCQTLEVVPLVKCALRMRVSDTVPVPRAESRPKSGEWVLVKMSERGRKTLVGQYVGEMESRSVVRVYESKPERKPEQLTQVILPTNQIVGTAPDSETLRAAKELVEIDTLRERRKALGVTQRDFAEVVGVGMGAVRDAEHGRRHTQKQVRHWLLEGLRKLEAQQRKQAA